MQRNLLLKRGFVAGVLTLAGGLAHAQTAPLDNTFGTNGRVFTTFTAAPTSDAAKAVVLQPDGKIVVAGDGAAGVEMARYNPDGTLDATFGTGGKVATMIAAASGSGCFASGAATPGNTTYGMCLQTDGKVVVVGSSSSRASFVARFLPNGTLDTGFGTNGATYVCGGTVAGYAVRVGQQPTGELLVLGHRVFLGSGNLPSSPSAYAARLRADGTFDVSYANDRFNTRFADGLVDNAGRAVAVGYEEVSRNPSTGTFNYRFVLTRYATSGAPDATFGTNGTADLGPFAASQPALGRAVAELPNGKLLVLGEAPPSNVPATQFLVRYNPDGTIDATFGNNGLISLGGTVNAFNFSEMALQPDGKIVLVGASNGNFALRRLLSNGQIDTTYGLNGTVTVNEDVNDALNDVLVQPDGQAVAVGYAASTAPGAAQPNSRFAVLRVLRTGGGLATRQPNATTGALQLAPNPAHGEDLNVTVNWPAPTAGPVAVEVVSALGQIVARVPAVAAPGQTRHSAALPTQALAAGVYVVRAQSASGVATGKLVVQ